MNEFVLETKINRDLVVDEFRLNGLSFLSISACEPPAQLQVPHLNFTKGQECASNCQSWSSSVFAALTQGIWQQLLLVSSDCSCYTELWPVCHTFSVS